MKRARRLPSATVQFSKFRMPEQLRSALEQESKRHGVSLSGEILGRLESSLEQPKLFTIDQLTENVTHRLVPVLERLEMLHLQAKIAHAAKELVDRILPLLAMRIIAGREGDALRQAADKVVAAIKVVDLTADTLQSQKERQAQKEER